MVPMLTFLPSFIITFIVVLFFKPGACLVFPEIVLRKLCVCMYVCSYVCIYVCMYICLSLRTHVSKPFT